MRRFPRELFRLLPISLFGVVLGHGLLYKYLFLDSTHHHDVTRVQHGYLPYFIGLSLCVATSSLGWYAWLGYSEKRYHRRSAQYSFWKSTVCLFLIQSLLFIAMEVLERTHGGVHGVWEFINSQFFVFGIVFQLLTAALAALSVRTAAFVGRQFALVQARATYRYLLAIVFIEQFIERRKTGLLEIRGPPPIPRIAFY